MMSVSYPHIVGGTVLAMLCREFITGEMIMIGSVAPYLMAAFAMSFAACSALVLISFISHLDAPETPVSAPRELERLSA